ncbi:threo-3-hydroxy-L-aspartate ammonia-lyase [Diaphorobacter sp.]|uniref:threo-3-hydroxy-L-aspartate ammonia-lyase n=1 Tax=Diaphorobacter sp. TaxID=1934310 RepID=UPI0025884F7E|nr:threo-3-hydroxy-L-aspartate ammonia-lyase [Diaphorobacter sp.]
MHLPRPPLPTYDDVAEAAHRLKGMAHRTPVLSSSTLDALLGAQVFFKCENLQRMGAFKFRGAFNALVQFSDAQRQRGVIAFSSGNHAQAIALSARLLEIPAVIVMPEDAPLAKIAATRGYGAEVVTYNRFTEDREAISRRLATERGMTLIPPFDHAHVIAGQGTVAKELLEDVPHLDYLFVPLGGGGLLSGCLLAARELAPQCKVVGVEPETGNDGQQSLNAGHVVRIDTPQTIADGAQTQALGALTFPLIHAGVSDIVTATDAQLMSAMHFFAERMKIVVEPTGALGLAGACHGGVRLRGKRVGVVISGGNVDMTRYAQLLTAASAD